MSTVSTVPVNPILTNLPSSLEFPLPPRSRTSGTPSKSPISPLSSLGSEISNGSDEEISICGSIPSSNSIPISLSLNPAPNHSGVHTHSPYSLPRDSYRSDSRLSIDSWADEMDAEDKIVQTPTSSPPSSFTSTSEMLSAPMNTPPMSYMPMPQHTPYYLSNNYPMTLPPSMSPYYGYAPPPPVVVVMQQPCGCGCAPNSTATCNESNANDSTRRSSKSYVPEPSIGEKQNTTPPASSVPSDSASDPRYKTKMCRRWLQSGECHFRQQCKFAHGPDELRVIPSCGPPLSSVGQLSNLLVAAMRLGHTPTGPSDTDSLSALLQQAMMAATSNVAPASK